MDWSLGQSIEIMNENKHSSYLFDVALASVVSYREEYVRVLGVLRVFGARVAEKLQLKVHSPIFQNLSQCFI